MAIDALGHINIKTSDFAETMRFWETAFGFVRGPAATLTDQERNAWLHAPDGRALIHVNTLAAGDVRPAGLVNRLDHVAFDCSDIAGTRSRLDAAGVNYTVVETRVPGLVQINLRDPNGIRVELTFGHEIVRQD
jgi:catechol 2,3-dioxygenase-like lactoylglutathione lyase family enzyme